MMIAYKCMNDDAHVFKGKSLDGVPCPICGGPVLTKPFDEQKDSALPDYRDLKKQIRKRYKQSQCLKCKHVQRNECNSKDVEVFVCEKCNGASVDTWDKDIKYPAKSKLKSTITIDLGFDDKSKLKLRAIANHAGALADELDAIDIRERCPECSKLMNTAKMFSDNELKSITSECECGFVMGCDFGNEVPIRLEGNE